MFLQMICGTIWTSRAPKQETAGAGMSHTPLVFVLEGMERFSVFKIQN